MKKSRARIVLWSLVALIALLIALRLALPTIVRNTLNQRMERMGEYHGHVDAISLSLWRSRYSLQHLAIVKVSGKVPVPLLDTRRLDVQLSWHALFHGAIRAKVDFRHPVVNLVDGSGHADTQAGAGVNWRSQLQHLVPIRLDEVNVHNGTITFHNFHSDPRVDLKATRLQATITNLTNASRSKGKRVAHMRANARILGQASLQTSGRFDPLGRLDDFYFELRVLHIKLAKLNDLARAYAGLDFAGGEGDFVLQLEARDGELSGYAKPLFHGMKIFSWKQDVEKEHKNPVRLAWEALAQGVTSIFKNHKHNQFATRVPIHGSIRDKKVGTLRAVFNVLHNAFVKAYTPQLEDLKPAPGQTHP